MGLHFLANQWWFCHKQQLAGAQGHVQSKGTDASPHQGRKRLNVGVLQHKGWQDASPKEAADTVAACPAALSTQGPSHLCPFCPWISPGPWPSSGTSPSHLASSGDFRFSRCKIMASLPSQSWFYLPGYFPYHIKCNLIKIQYASMEVNPQIIVF